MGNQRARMTGAGSAPDRFGQNRRIAELPSIPSGYERLLPPTVQLTVRTRRRALARRASGRVLDLGGSTAHDVLWDRPGVEVTAVDGADDPALLRLVDADHRFDAVLSVFQLTAASDLAGTLSRISRVLDDDGRLLFLEPTRIPGRVLRRAQRFVAPVVDVAAGWRVDRDIPAEIRRAGLSVTDVERHRSNTVQWWLRALVEGAAHRELPAA